MPSTIPTVWPLEPHTKAKHTILKNYLQAWFPILAETSGRIIYLDGFAGPGVYEGGEDGSPVIALKTALDHILKPSSKAELSFMFVEKDKKRADTLHQVLQSKFPSLPANISYNILGAEFAPTLSSVLDELEKGGAKLAPTLAFIDPFGFSGLPMRLIGRMMSYSRCEVIITFMCNFVNRFTDELREDTLDELFASPDWREVRKISDPEKRYRFFISLYANQLKSVGNCPYIRNFEMIGEHNQPIYNLFYGTKHIKGLEAMKEAMWNVDKRGTYRFSDLTDVGQRYLIEYSEERHWNDKAGEMVYSRFKGQTVSLTDIHKFVIVETPFIFRKSILKQLEKREPSLIGDVQNRQKNYTYPDGCIVTFN